MRIALVLSLIAVAIAVPAAAGDGGPSPGVDQGGNGILSPFGALRYVAVPTAAATILEAIRVRGGLLWSFRVLPAHYGIPYVTNLGDRGGLSRDGRLLVLSDAVGAGLRRVSRFIVLGTRRLQTKQRIGLRGDFSYDALSPDAATLYLIQHTSARDYTRYAVRAYDLRAGWLLPRAIVDRRESKDAMRGLPVTRVTAPDGGWVYTLYADGKMPFVHALDTVHRSARCLDLPWKGSQNQLWNARLRLSADGRKLLVVVSPRVKPMTIGVPG